MVEHTKKLRHRSPDLAWRRVIIGSGELIDHVIDPPLARAKAHNCRGGVVQFEPGLGVQEQMTAGMMIEPEPHFLTKPRPDGGASYHYSAFLLNPFYRGPGRGDRAWSTKYRPS